MTSVSFTIFLSKISATIGGLGGFSKCLSRMPKSVFLNPRFSLLLQCKYSVHPKDTHLIRTKIDLIKRRALCKGSGKYSNFKVKYIIFLFTYSLYIVTCKLEYLHLRSFSLLNCTGWVICKHYTEHPITKSGEYEHNLPSVFLEEHDRLSSRFKPNHGLILYLRC